MLHPNNVCTTSKTPYSIPLITKQSCNINPFTWSFKLKSLLLVICTEHPTFTIPHISPTPHFFENSNNNKDHTIQSHIYSVNPDHPLVLLSKHDPIKTTALLISFVFSCSLLSGMTTNPLKPHSTTHIIPPELFLCITFTSIFLIFSDRLPTLTHHELKHLTHIFAEQQN